MNRKRVTCAVILREGRVLLARRAPGQKNAGLWEFPGGKVEAGESDEACLAREMREEFGVTGIVGAHLTDSAYTYGQFGLSILLCAYLFTPEDDSFDLRVHDRIGFFSGGEIGEIPLSPADIPIAEFVISNLLSAGEKQ